MIHTRSLGRAARYYPERTAFVSGRTRSTFRELHARVVSIATALSKHGFGVANRLALLLPNEPEYIELVYACSWLGMIAISLNTRFSAIEIDCVLADASPRGLIRHSSLPVPTVPLSWQRVLDEEPSDLRSDAYPDALYYSEAILALVFPSGTTGRLKGVVLTQAATLANVDHVNYWMPYRDGVRRGAVRDAGVQPLRPRSTQEHDRRGFTSLRAQCMGREAGRGGQRFARRDRRLWCQPPPAAIPRLSQRAVPANAGGVYQRHRKHVRRDGRALGS